MSAMDEKLRELVRDALTPRMAGMFPTHRSTELFASELAAVALATINASGLAWIAPWEATEAMRRTMFETGPGMADKYASARGSYLRRAAGQEGR